MLKLLWGFVVGITIGCLIGAYNPNLVTPTDLQNCRDELATCQDSLNDPHHCVSVVVDVLEGKDVNKNE